MAILGSGVGSKRWCRANSTYLHFWTRCNVIKLPLINQEIRRVGDLTKLDEMKNRIKPLYIVVSLFACMLPQACKKEFLEPRPLSFFTPEETFKSAQGLWATLVS